MKYLKKWGRYRKGLLKKNLKKVEKLERKKVYRVEYINFLENLKILEIFEDCMYVDVKVLYIEIIRNKDLILDRVLLWVWFIRYGKELKVLV